ncbi:hypothetical protein EI94DRAFT_1705028 [Lactarius quietus]|nr:hypothetical protein EI94DRAFT_1705028 [Lactarius quietus]
MFHISYYSNTGPHTSTYQENLEKNTPLHQMTPQCYLHRLNCPPLVPPPLPVIYRRLLGPLPRTTGAGNALDGFVTESGRLWAQWPTHLSIYHPGSRSAQQLAEPPRTDPNTNPPSPNHYPPLPPTPTTEHKNENHGAIHHLMQSPVLYDPLHAPQFPICYVLAGTWLLNCSEVQRYKWTHVMVVKGSCGFKVVHQANGRAKWDNGICKIKTKTKLGYKRIQATSYIPYSTGLYGFDVRGPPSLRMQYWLSILGILHKIIGTEVIVTVVPGTGSITSCTEQLDRFLQAKAPGRGINFMVHSMGGLDCHHLITHLKLVEYTLLLLTTIAMPHRGSPFMDWCKEYPRTAAERICASDHATILRMFLLHQRSMDYVSW